MLRIGLDLGGTKTEGIVMSPSGEILERERRPTPRAEGYEAILASICELVRDLERRARQTCQVGIGTPGAISTRTGTLKNSNTVCMNGRPLHTDLSRQLNRPIRIANDANCFALSEAHDGAGAGMPVVFGVILGTGVGGGIVINGKLLDGLQHIGGEWGHNVLEADGPACYCGKHGCVETFLSGPGFEQRYRENGGDASADAAAIAARTDDIARDTTARYIDRFGRALATVINILDPHVVVLGGGLSNIERLYTDGRDAVARYVFNDELRTRIVRNQHGDSSGVRGAARLWDPGE